MVSAECGSTQYWSLFLGPPPFASNSAMLELTNAEKTRILNETSVPRFRIRLLRLLLKVLKDRAEASDHLF